MDQLALVNSGPLLLGAVALSAIGIGTVLLLVGRSVSLARSHEPLARGLAELRCQAILDALPDPVALREEGGRLAAANATFIHLAGGRNREPEVLASGAVRRLSGDARLVDQRMATPAGPRWYSWTETPVEIEGRRFVLRSGHENTERVETERELTEARARAEGASEAKTRFLASVSHEFRTPLNGILGMSGLLAETQLDAEQRTYLSAVRSSAEAFLALVDEILDFSKIEAGRIELADEPFDLSALVQGVVELLAPRAQGKGTGIACFIAPDMPRNVRGDADRLRQVLFNLAGNAVKFTASGGVGVTVERGAGAAVVIRVEDTGPGIAPEAAAKVFDEFEQAEGSVVEEPGTGLGLAITRRLVERMNGAIALQSEPGAGSRFTVTLDLPEAPPIVESAKGLVLVREPLRALVLCGAPFEGAYLVRTLVGGGCDATLAETLPDALRLMGERSFDVVIADHGMPDADVRVVAQEARRCGVGRSIVLLSPFERRDFGSPHAAGFDAYLTKPVRARSLFEQVRGGMAREAVPAATPVASVVAPTGRRAKRVLLAEDNEVNALVAMRTLEKLGAVVEWAKDGLEALARVETALAPGGLGFDLILMDVRMPGMNGCDVTRCLREFERVQGRRRLRIVALTASVVEDPRVLVGPDAFDAALRKPFAVSDLGAELGMNALEPLALAS